jgi:hypothetical protein
MRMVNLRHFSTQVDFSYQSIPSQQTTSYASLQYGTLYNPHHPSYDHQSDTQNIPFTLVGPTSKGNFTSGSHFHNVLILQQDGDHADITKLKVPFTHEETTQHLSNSKEPNLQNDISYSVEIQTDDRSIGDTDDNNIFAETNSNTVLINTQEKISHASDNSCMTRENKACMALEDILRKVGAPLYMYDDIMKWAIKHKNDLPTRVPPISRTKLYSSLSQKFYGEAAKDMMPKEIPTTLPSGRQCGVTVFNIYSQITSLLGNSDINHWDNYFFHPTHDDPFNLNLFTNWEDSSFNDIETSI